MVPGWRRGSLDAGGAPWVLGEGLLGCERLFLGGGGAGWVGGGPWVVVGVRGPWVGSMGGAVWEDLVGSQVKRCRMET